MRRVPERFGESWRRIVHCDELNSVAVRAINMLRTWHRRCATAFSSMACKHRLEVAGGAADDLKHLRRCSLLL